jgi:hypothetical protein
MLIGNFLGQQINLLLAIRRTLIAQLTSMSTQTVTQLPLNFREMRREDLLGDGQSRQRGPSPLLGYFTCSPDLTSEEGASIGMKRGVGHIS